MIHSINGIEFNGIQATWAEVPTVTAIDQTRQPSPWPQLIWSVDFMLKPDWLLLQGMQFVAITSLQSVDYKNRSAQGAYSQAFMSSVSGRQVGHRIENIEVTFRVGVGL